MYLKGPDWKKKREMLGVIYIFQWNCFKLGSHAYQLAYFIGVVVKNKNKVQAIYAATLEVLSEKNQR